MGFTTGALAGAALVTLTLHLTLRTHTLNRTHQSTLLRQQSRLLNNITDPPPEVPIVRERIERAGVLEAAKDRWNREVEDVVRRVSEGDWRRARERGEVVLGAVWRRARELGRGAVEEGKEKSS